MRVSGVAVVVLLSAAAAACSGGPSPAVAVTSPAAVASAAPSSVGRVGSQSRTSTAAPRPTAAKPAPRAGVCPARPPDNGPLNDQGEQVGRIGASSDTFINRDVPGLQYCIAVVSVVRQGRAAVVTVMMVNNGSVPLNLDNDDQIKVGLAYGDQPARDDFDVDVTALQGVLPPGRTLRGQYAFTVPGGRQDVTVSVGPALSTDQAAYVGTLT